jgi:hypothetical protein
LHKNTSLFFWGERGRKEEKRVKENEEELSFV